MTYRGPTRTESAKIGSIGELLVQAELSKFSVCNSLHNDFGIDVICHISVGDVVGYPCFVQIKTVGRVQSDTFSVALSRTASAWAEQPIPVFLIVCVLEPTPQFLWRDGVTEFERASANDSLRLTYSRSDLADGNILAGIADSVAKHILRKRIEEEERALAKELIIDVQRTLLANALTQKPADFSTAVSIISKYPRLAGDIPPASWEELIASAFIEAGFADVNLTPRSGDTGRDIVATTTGFGRVKLIASVKAYKPGRTVRSDDVRALVGVLSAEQSASKAIMFTPNEFSPRILEDPFIKPLMPYRLELVDGESLRAWLAALLLKKDRRAT